MVKKKTTLAIKELKRVIYEHTYADINSCFTWD